ncbi:histidine phosphatase family protein [Acidocella sp.]|uniref:histidine phosphatase family protein n=1 Tax=Acidocella sp. TaxID=50710 RepID=UPI003CFF8D71
MSSPPVLRLLLIRHARAVNRTDLAGRLDVPAQPPHGPSLAHARQRLAALWPDPPRLVTSPALRCRQTASALLPGIPAHEDARLWEQYFGAWEGQATASLPDLGPLSRAALAAYRPPGGENFQDLASRATPALREIATQGPAIIVTHAGVIRAALGLLGLGEAALGLAFEIAPLSATLLTASAGDAWAIGFVNLPLAPQ